MARERGGRGGRGRVTAMERRRKGETRAQPRTGSSRRQFSPGNAIDSAPACQSEHRASATRDHTQPANPALRRIQLAFVGSGLGDLHGLVLSATSLLDLTRDGEIDDPFQL